MRTRLLFCTIALAVAVVGLGRPADAEMILSFSAPAVDESVELDAVQVGEIFTVDVLLSGLVDEHLEDLGATVQFDAAMFELASLDSVVTGSALTPNPYIIPDTDYALINSGISGEVGVNYNALFGPEPDSPPGQPITSNGTFFSFDLRVLAASYGTISFFHAGAAGVDGEAQIDSTHTLVFDLTDSGVVVPVPPSLVLLGTGMTSVWGLLRFRRRRPAPALADC